uniref:Kunitz-type serine protease inhibitor A n=1 Tax=Bungarus candidus TaxID=92438 RepID=VKTA_BUNCA|nr:RecName: Full=Kunitz-type serine protease inhibitor A; AltName: Full=Kunitz inhibitor A; Flags: Precursor [Bungarus candidus]
MSSGGLLLLLGLLTLCAELTPVSSKDRPKFCNVPPEPGRCNANVRAFYYNPRLRKCIEFTYGGCGGNANNFKSRGECKRTCAE